MKDVILLYHCGKHSVLSEGATREIAVNTVRHFLRLPCIFIGRDARRHPQCEGLRVLDPMESLGWPIRISEWMSRASGRMERAAGIRSWKKERDALESLWYDYLVSTHCLTSDLWSGPQHPVLVGWSSMSLLSGRKIKRLGGTYILMSQWSHANSQHSRVQEEWKTSGVGGEPFSRWRMKRQLREYDEADFILSPSQYVTQSHLQQGIPEERLIQVSYGVAYARFRGLRKELHSKGRGPFRILFVGTVILRKGIRVLLEAVAAMKIPSAVVTLNGSPDRECRSLIGAYAPVLRSRGVSLLVDPGPPERNLGQADLLVHPAAEEAFGLVVLEAMAAGVPAVVSDQVGAKDCIDDGEDGFIFALKKPQALVQILENLYRNPHLRRAAGIKAARKAERYDWALVTRRLENEIADRLRDPRTAALLGRP